MNTRLPFWQFKPAEYLTGTIQFCTLEAQGLFANIEAIYWQRKCDLTVDQVNRKFKRDDLLKELINENVVKEVNGKIKIDFLDIQYDELYSRYNANSKNGRQGAEVRWRRYSQANAGLEKNHSDRLALKVNKENKEEKKKRVFVPPSVDQVVDYFKLKGYSEQAARKAFEYYSELDWHDRNGGKIQNWKSKMISVWFKEENRVGEKQKSKFGFI